MKSLALAAFASASTLVAAPVFAQSAPAPQAPVVIPAPSEPAVATPASDGGCAWKKQYTS